jgi:hypothetical protein
MGTPHVFKYGIHQPPIPVISLHHVKATLNGFVLYNRTIVALMRFDFKVAEPRGHAEVASEFSTSAGLLCHLAVGLRVQSLVFGAEIHSH